MSESLFRQEAIENKKEKLWGEVLLIQPLSYHIVSIALLLVVISLLSLLIFGDYARREKVRGYIVPDKGMVKVYPNISGSVAEIYVSEGEQVKEGDLLARIYTGKGTKLGEDFSETLILSLKNQERLVKSKIEQEEKLLASESNRLTSLIDGLNKELNAISSRQNRLQKRIEISSKQFENVKQLAKSGFASGKELEVKQDQHLALLSEYDSGNQNIVSTKNRIKQAETELVQLPLNTSRIMSDLQSQLSQLRQRLLEVEGQSTYTLKSAVDGRVTSLQIVVGQAVSPNMPILAILPKDAVLQAELFVPSRAVGFIDKASKVFIRYDAFPYQRFGLYQGTIINVAEAIFRPDELPVPVPLNEPVYRVKVALDSQSVKAYGKEFVLQSGMLLEADVVLETRSLLEWLLEPVYSLRGRI